MKTITVSFLLIVALATILFLSVWGLTGSVDAAKGAAAFAVTALPSVSSWLEQSEAKRSIIPGYKMAIRSIDGFSISLPVLVAVGTMIALAILIIGNAFSSFVLESVRSVFSQAPELSDAEKAALISLSGLANLPILLVGTYLLGKWVSWRCARNGILAVVLIALLTAFLNRLTDFFILTPGEFQALFQREKTIPNLAPFFLVQFVSISVPGLLGFWRGRRERMSKYMGYLLSALPEETRNSLVDLAFDEVKKIVDAQRQQSRPANLAVASAP